MLPSLYLKARADKRLRQGHLWIYSNEVDSKRSPLNSFEIGSLVVVVSDKGKSLGIATLNPKVLMCGRLITRNVKANINRKFFIKKIQQALSLRELYFDKPFYRLMYGDSDFLPGVVCDRFGSDLVVQLTTAGMENFKQEILEAFDDAIEPSGMILQNDHSARALEELPNYSERFGELGEQFLLEENGVQFAVPVEGGQKTGWFYDHRANRAQLQKFSNNKTVLDVFSYVGGWGVQAAAAGATQVSFIDASEKALGWVERAYELNKLGHKPELLHGKAVDQLKALIEAGRKFDIVVLDPPAFIKRKKDLKNGSAAYRHINELAMRLVEAGGILISASCSMHLADDSLADIVRASAAHLDRDAQQIFKGSQAPDHPVHPSIVETQYLKALFYRLSRR
ncbi:class I SAM-dependent rRNA methyltransferase [Agaribacterium haliotis]|uniref:class I SAM-dependent rRNA methyltransferase n=1 Tax=Agaribacterium haliotis TaxID=2013869 RepID=UPI001864BD5C|nr:class I SAM-dependent rRNA methyltransferase [Agaribacterium haliotis]